jgi:hypothetical protein
MLVLDSHATDLAAAQQQLDHIHPGLGVTQAA